MITLYNGDCLEVMKQIPDNSIDLVLTDPPYLLSTGGGEGCVNKIMKLKDSLKDVSDAKIDNGYDIQSFGDIIIKKMKGINVYFWCNKIQIPDYFNFFVNKHKCKFDIICWHKTNPLPTYSNKYVSDTEYCLYFHKDGYGCHPTNYEDAKTFYIAPINSKDKALYGHPTIKPVDVIEKLVRNSTKDGMTVLDAFMGSGTTGVACKHLNRNFIGIEIDKKYFQIAQDRINGELL